ncbi:MAG TPA: tail fiber domain-containing protein [Methylomirabilota bacterium]|nr:tail fiber domain-containing protein [Methylomirabilota bacterium]
MSKSSLTLRWTRSCLLLLVAFSTLVSGQSQDAASPPALIAYQGYLVDGNGAPLGADAPRNYDVVFRIYDDLGTDYWTEGQTVTVDKGYFSVMLGEGTQVGNEPRPALATVFTGASAANRLIGFTVKRIGAGNPPADVELRPRVKLVTAPYAFLAENAMKAQSLASSSGSSVVSVKGANVGINNADPASALDVAGDVTAQSLTAGVAHIGTSGAWAAFKNVNVIGNNAALSQNADASRTVLMARTGGTVDFAFSGSAAVVSVTGDGAVTATKFVGSVAGGSITGTVPDAALTRNVALLSADQTFSGALTLNGTVNIGGAQYLGDHNIYLRGSPDRNHGLGYNSDADGPALYGYSGGVLKTTINADKEVMRWTSDGRIGIGTSSPGKALHVKSGQDTQLKLEKNGVSRAWEIGTDFNGNLGFASIVGATYGKSSYISYGDGQYYVNSDARLKTDVEPIDGALEKTLKLRPVSYHFKTDDAGAMRSLGFLAQEIEGVLPEVTDENKGVKSVAYSEIVPVTVGAIQQLHAESERKERQIQELKSELQSLRAMVEKLAIRDNASTTGR